MDIVSIVTPCYNSKQYIRETITSVIAQTYPYWELIIVDDCSTDGSVAVVEEYLSDPRVRLIRLSTNQGPVIARNTAIEHAKGKYIAFLDSDDVWLPQKLEKQVPLFKQDNVGIVFSWYKQMNSKGDDISDVISPAEVTYKTNLITNHIGCLTAVYNVSLLGKRYFIEHGHEDYILWLSILKEGYIAVNANELLAKYRKLDNSLSANKLKAAKWQWKIYRNIEKIGLIRSLYFFCTYAYYALKKHKSHWKI